MNLLPEDEQLGVRGRRVAGEAPASGAGMVYAPTILIGLGGTGAEVLLRVKKLLQERTDVRSRLHRFLFIDTDQKTYASRHGLPSVESSEECLIGVVQAQEAIRRPHLYPQLWERFPEDRLDRVYLRELARGRGASQIRSLGAAAFILDYDKVRQRLETTYRDLIDLSARIQTKEEARGGTIKDSVLIYIVASLAGGTGSGCFLDVALLAEDVCRARDPRIAAFLALPEAFDPKLRERAQRINTRANTYAALKELQFLLDAGEEERKRAGTIHFTYERAGHADIELVPDDRLLHLCFLVGDRNRKGKLSELPDLYSLIARSVYQDVGSPFGGNVDSFTSNVSVFTGMSHCPETRRPRLFGTISTASLVYPAERVARYCAFRTAESVVHDRVKGGVPHRSDIRDVVGAFLERHRLEEREHNQILEELLSDPATREVIAGDGYALRATWGAKKTGKEFVAAIRGELDRFRNAELPRIKEIIDGNRERVLGGADALPATMLREAVERLALDAAVRFGALAACEVLEEAEQAALQMQDELQQETTRWRTTDQGELQLEFDEACQELAEIGRVREKFTKRDEQLEEQLRFLYREYVQELLWAEARPAALEVIDKLLARIRDARARWEALVGRLDSLLRTLRTAAGDLESRRRTERSQGFVVDQEVTRPGYERRFYEANRLDVDEALSRILQSLAADASEAEQKIEQLFLEALEAGDNAFGNLVLGPLYESIAPPLLQTSVVDFVREQPEEVDGAGGLDGLAHKLEILMDLCQPFWEAERVGGVEFPEFRGMSAAPTGQTEEGKLEYHRALTEWARQNEFELIPSTAPYEITLGRRTYGARAYYLSPTSRWWERYEQRRRTAEGRFMLHTHAAFEDLPPLSPEPPEGTRPLRLFALGSALGFIVQRGDWYYLALERSSDAQDREIIRVLYPPQDWTTVHDLEGVPEVPEKAGRVDFGRTRESPSKSHQLAQGRTNAVAALKDKSQHLDLLEEAADEYHRHVGNGPLREQLLAYCERVLEPRVRDQGDLFSRELAEIRERVRRIGA